MDFQSLVKNMMEDLPEDFKIIQEDASDLVDAGEENFNTVAETSQSELVDGVRVQFDLYNTDVEDFYRVQGVLSDSEGKQIGTLEAWLNRSRASESAATNFHNLPGMDVPEEAHRCFTSVFDHLGKVRLPFSQSNETEALQEGVLEHIPCDASKGVLFVAQVEAKQYAIPFVAKCLEVYAERYGVAFVVPHIYNISPGSEAESAPESKSLEFTRLGFKQLTSFAPFCELWVLASPATKTITIGQIMPVTVYKNIEWPELSDVDKQLQANVSQGCSKADIQKLLDNGASLEKSMALHVSIECGQLETSRALLELGSSPLWQNPCGNTALHEFAAMVGDEEEMERFDAWCNFYTELVKLSGKKLLLVKNMRYETPAETARRSMQYAEDFARVFGIENHEGSNVWMFAKLIELLSPEDQADS